jgi:hypothetical protein
MNIAGNLVQAIGDGISGLVGGAIQALGAAAQSILNSLQSLLPGLWLPIAAVAAVAVVAWTFLKR